MGSLLYVCVVGGYGGVYCVECILVVLFEVWGDFGVGCECVLLVYCCLCYCGSYLVVNDRG